MADNMKQWWNALSLARKVGLAAGAVAIFALFFVAATWLARDDYQVLFADLDPQDGAAIVAELDRMKVPYRLSDNGGTVLVLSLIHI